MSKTIRVLIVEDSEDDALLVLREIRREGYEPIFERVETEEAMSAALKRQEWDIVISDYRMPHFSVPSALTVLKDSGLDLPFIVVSGTIGEETAVAIMRAGAHDYLMKNNLKRIVPAIERELREAEVRRERKRAEKEMASLQEQLYQSQKMEAIGRLAGGIAHDFNNLLTIISGNAQLCLLELKTGNPLRESMEAIRKTSDKAAGLIRQLLAFSRRQVMEMKVLDLNEPIRDLEKMLHRVIGEDIELVVLLAKELGKVKIDPGQMEQVILNLVVNAKDAMPLGGKITIETANAELDEAYAISHVAVKAGRYVRLSVSDTGTGMPPEVKERIFEPFFTTKEMGKGTGLGLSTVYGIVKQSGGYIWVYSEPGQGATFKIYLPQVDEPLTEVEKGKITEDKFLGGSETILVVEDDEEVRRLAAQILQRGGYRILQASQGAEAFLICQQHKELIHLLLTDVVMPRMSGRELARQLESLHPDMRVLYMSGYADSTIAHHGILEEGINYIQKPFSVDGLLRKVREVLDAPLKAKM